MNFSYTTRCLQKLKDTNSLSTKKLKVFEIDVQINGENWRGINKQSLMVGSLRPIKGMMNADSYIQIVKNNIQQDMDEAFPNSEGKSQFFRARNMLMRC